jgi:type IV pilus assembly protein PilO
MAGALSDFGRKSTQYKVGVFAAIAVVLGLIYWKGPLPFGYKKTHVKLEKARGDNKSLINESNKLDADAKEYKKKLAEADQLNKIIEENQKALPTEAELPAFFDTLGRKIGEAQVEVRRWDYQKEVPIDAYVKVPVEIEVTGTFYQLKRFFSSLSQRDQPPPTPNPDGTTPPEERERIVTIENLQIYDPKIRNRELVMTAKFTASTFRQDAPAPDAKAKDKDKDKKKPGAAGSGSGAGSAGSALPPAATPDGVKARTEGALQTDVKRTEDGLGSASPTAGSDKLKGGVP